MGISQKDLEEMIKGSDPVLLASPDLAIVGIKPQIFEKPEKSKAQECNTQSQNFQNREKSKAQECNTQNGSSDGSGDEIIVFRSKLERVFADYLKLFSIPFHYEFTGWTDNKMSIDFYHEPSRLGIEINGGAHYPEKINGKWYVPVSGHNSHDGLMRDFEKGQRAAEVGIQIITLGADHISKNQIGVTMSKIQRAIKLRLQLYLC